MMGALQRKAIGGSCLGGLLGACVGISLGGWIGYALVEPTPVSEALPLTSGFLHLAGGIVQWLSAALGAFLGGLLLAIAGAVAGTALATQSRSVDPADPSAPVGSSAFPPKPENWEPGP